MAETVIDKAIHCIELESRMTKKQVRTRYMFLHFGVRHSVISLYQLGSAVHHLKSIKELVYWFDQSLESQYFPQTSHLTMELIK